MFDRKTVQFVRLSSLLNQDELEQFSDVCDVSYGDASHTLISPLAFCNILREMMDWGDLTEERFREIGEQLGLTAWPVPTYAPRDGFFIDLES